MAREAGRKGGSETTSVRRRGRPKVGTDEDKRRAIIDGARQAFMDFGFAETTIDVIAARCHVSKSTVYGFFDSKMDLLIAVVEGQGHVILNLGEETGKIVSIRERLIGVFWQDFCDGRDRERQDFQFFFFNTAYQFPEILLLLRSRGAIDARAEFSEWLKKRCDEGLLEIEDTLRAAGILMGMVFGPLANPAYEVGAPVPVPARKAHLEKCVDIFLSGTLSR